MQRLRESLLSAAAVLVASGCGNKSPQVEGCGAGPPSPTVSVDAAVACAIATEQGSGMDSACAEACMSSYISTACGLPQSYLDAYNAAYDAAHGISQLDAGQGTTEAGAVDGSDGASLPAGCPAVVGPITVQCTFGCLGGRLTEGFATVDRAGCDGERLANMAWLEAVSVHAFERLERELAAHGAPPAFRRNARRARRDEVRHTAMTTRLARHRGVTPAVPDTPSTMQVRTLVDVAVENAVEGCVRETYGALLAFVEALSSPEPSLRRAMRSIAEDECRHAELAWSVHAWALPRLRPAERKRVEDALRAAAREVPAWDLLQQHLSSA